MDQSTLNFCTAPAGWVHTDPNPFTPDGSYGHGWGAFCLEAREDDQFFTGQSGQGPFSARFGLGTPHLENRLADFLRYERAQGRKVILTFPQDVNVEALVERALSSTPAAAIVRPEDPPILVHATTKAAWASIQAEGELKAASQIKKVRQPVTGQDEPNPIEAYLRNEPPEYPDYIMFGEMGSYSPEMVVASYAAGQFISDTNAVFEPGVRLYFDAHRIIRDGLGTRDGLHVLKVHKRLPLQPYLLAAIGLSDIDPPGMVPRWTVGAFVDRANALFQVRL